MTIFCLEKLPSYGGMEAYKLTMTELNKKREKVGEMKNMHFLSKNPQQHINQAWNNCPTC